MGNQLEVVAVPCHQDNYSYLVFSHAGEGTCLVIDACEFAPIQAELTRRSLRPVAILSTHHHWDHVGGNLELTAAFEIPIYGHQSEVERIPGLGVGLSHGEAFKIAGIEGVALHVPGHTLGALSYVLGELCFTGDTLFCGGCGRIFEGTVAQMHHSLTQVLAHLPAQTQLYTGHEYTVANLRFAATIYPSAAVEQCLVEVAATRKAGQFCASASLSTERETNLFLKCHEFEVQRAILGAEVFEQSSGLSATELELLAFTQLRQLKDRA